MNYNVQWSAEAENELMRVWLAASNRRAVTDAVNRLEKGLKSAPLELGESRYDQRRIAFEPPIAISFDVSANLVKVLNLWHF